MSSRKEQLIFKDVNGDIIGLIKDHFKDELKIDVTNYTLKSVAVGKRSTSIIFEKD